MDRHAVTREWPANPYREELATRQRLCPIQNHSTFRIFYPDYLSRGDTSNLADQIFEQPLVGWHLVVGCFEHHDSERELLDIVFVLKTFVNREKGVEPALELGDENVIWLPGPSEIPYSFDDMVGKKCPKTGSKPGIDALVDQDSAHSETRSCTSSR